MSSQVIALTPKSLQRIIKACPWVKEIGSLPLHRVKQNPSSLYECLGKSYEQDHDHKVNKTLKSINKILKKINDKEKRQRALGEYREKRQAVFHSARTTDDHKRIDSEDECIIGLGERALPKKSVVFSDSEDEAPPKKKTTRCSSD
jgi:hypothetical protein